jgi:hypothetical protein
LKGRDFPDPRGSHVRKSSGFDRCQQFPLV